MEWLLGIVLGPIVAKLVDWTMESIRDRWRKRQITPADELRRLTRHFWYAAIGSVYSALLVPAFLAYAGRVGAGWYLAAGIAALAAILYGRSARRRWARWQQARRLP